MRRVVGEDETGDSSSLAVTLQSSVIFALRAGGLGGVSSSPDTWAWVREEVSVGWSSSDSDSVSIKVMVSSDTGEKQSEIDVMGDVGNAVGPVGEFTASICFAVVGD